MKSIFFLIWQFYCRQDCVTWSNIIIDTVLVLHMYSNTKEIDWQSDISDKKSICNKEPSFKVQITITFD